MTPLSTERLRRDRKKMQTALREYETGKAAHLAEGEKDHLVASIRQRIAYLNEQIARGEDF